jgi:hypothetical protein
LYKAFLFILSFLLSFVPSFLRNMVLCLLTISIYS